MSSFAAATGATCTVIQNRTTSLPRPEPFFTAYFHPLWEVKVGCKTSDMLLECADAHRNVSNGGEDEGKVAGS